MNILVSWTQTPAAHALGTVLLHTLWQAPLAAAALWVALKFLPAARAQIRSAAAGLALAAVVIAAAVTHAAITLPASSHASDTSAIVVAADNPTSPSAPRSTDIPPLVGPTGQIPPTPTPTPWSAFALAAWALGATLLLLNTLRAVTATHALTRGPGTGRVEPWAQDVLAEVKQRLHIRRTVRLLTSTAAHTPVVLGALFPAIVLPPALAAGLTTQQLRVVLAHELAHIKRHDYLVNLVQRLIEALLFFNPAVWFIGRQIRLEREAACDHAAAAALDGDRLHVARTLVDVLQKLGPAPFPTQATAALALGQPHESTLSTRVRRLLHPHLRDAVRIPWPTLLLLITLSSAALYAVACGSEAAVSAVDKIVNPEKYVADTRQFLETSPQFAPPPRHAPDGQERPEDLGRISGVVTTHDGVALKGRYVFTLVDVAQGGAHGSGSSTATADDLGIIYSVGNLRPGHARVLAHVPGYGPVISPPVRVQTGTTTPNIDLVLPASEDLPVRVVNPEGLPIAGAKFSSLTVRAGNSGSGIGHSVAHLRTDTDGRMVIPDTGPIRYSGVVTAPGYEHQSSEIRPQAGDTWTIQLHPAIPVHGMIRSAETGQPIPGARIRLAYDGALKRSLSPQRQTGPPLAETDSEGRFTLSTLGRSGGHTLWFEAPGHTPTLLRGVTPSPDAALLVVTLRPAIRLDLQLLAAPQNLLHPRTGRPRIQLSQRLQLRPNRSALTGVSGQTTERSNTYTFDGPLLDGPATFNIGDRSFLVDDLRAFAEQNPSFDLASNPDTAKRRVIIRFRPPPGWPVPTGTARVNYLKRPDDRYLRPTDLPLQDGQVAFDVILGDRADFSVRSVNAPGYWLGGQRDSLTVTAGDGPFIHEQPVHPAGVLTGQVFGPNAQPLPGAQVKLQEIDASPAGKIDANSRDVQTGTDAQGRFLISPVPFVGQYRVVIQDPEQGRYHLIHGPAFTLSKDRPRHHVAVRSPPTQTVTVSVYHPDGRPLANVPVDLRFRSSVSSHGWSPAPQTDRNGRVRFENLNFEHPAARWTLQALPSQGLRGQHQTLRKGKAEVRINLQPGVEVSGIARDHLNQAPVPNVEVTAQYAERSSDNHPDDRGTVVATSGPDGRFTLRGLAPATAYVIGLWHHSHHAEAHTVDRDDQGKITGIRMDGTRFTTPARTDGEAEPLALRVVVNPWNR